MTQRPLIHRAGDAVRRCPDMTYGQRIIVLEFLSHGNPDGSEIRPSVATVAKAVGANDRTVQRTVELAETLGFLLDVTPPEVRASQVRTHEPNVYQALDPGGPQTTSPGGLQTTQPVRAIPDQIPERAQPIRGTDARVTGWLELAQHFEAQERGEGNDNGTSRRAIQ
jgi:hypothetical protein